MGRLTRKTMGWIYSILGFILAVAILGLLLLGLLYLGTVLHVQPAGMVVL